MGERGGGDGSCFISCLSESSSCSPAAADARVQFTLCECQQQAAAEEEEEEEQEEEAARLTSLSASETTREKKKRVNG